MTIITEAQRGQRIRNPRTALSLVVWQLLILAAVLLLWLGLSAILGDHLFPRPLEVLVRLFSELALPSFWLALGQTLLSTLLGLAIAAGIAIPLGLLFGASRFATASTRVPLDFLASIPPVSFLPLALLLFSSTLPMKLILIVYGCLWPLLLRTIDALRDIEELQREVCVAFALSPRNRWLRVYLPATLPGIMVGLRTATTISLLLSIIAEYIGGAAGLGAELLWGQQNTQPDLVLAIALVTAVLGVIINRGMRLVERAVISWHPSVRGESV